ncbi:MAG TPA: EAL domain-containing protein [Steroidobacteraceae bacterium]|nr:EAL domain-containing protein [Steroidobacteraceae bacterium]
MGSFRKRLLVLIIGLVVITQTVTLAAVLASTAHNVEARAAEELRAGGSFAQQLLRFRAGQLANGVGVLAADFGFREAVASGDGPTILSAATNNAQRIGADLVLVMDTHGKVIASSDTAGAERGTSLDTLLDQSRGQRDQPIFRVLGEHSYQFFLAPVRTPETIAWVAMGFVVDDGLAQRMRDLIAADVTLVVYGADGVPRVASTLTGEQRTAAVAQRTSLSDTSPSDAESESQVHRIALTGCLSYAQRIGGRGDSVDVIVQKPMHEVLAPYRDVRDALLFIDGIALVVAAIIGSLLGRSATRPIGDLVEAAKRIQAGRYDTAVAASGGDEFRSLADTFNSMQKNIAEREADITHQAHHDSLTGLPNRTLAEKRLEELVSSGRGSPTALILIDMRNVREINASLGHHVGDDVLREAARRLRMNSGPEDLVARLGESQFLMIARDCSPERAPLYADQLTGVVRTGFHLAEMSLELRVAASVCMFPDHGSTASELLRRVQIAIEDVDEARTRVVLYRPGVDEEHRRRLKLITDLRGAIDQNTLSLVYQPKVAMATRSVRSLEALVRWTHPQLGAVSPGEFVPLAERTGGARRLTSWVLRAAIRQMGEWRRQGLELELAVNLSAPDILDPNLGDEILQLLRAERVNSTALLLEITESAVMRDPQQAARNMQLLRIAGVRFAIDDFGTGHSSLSQLSSLPVDELKIDRSFITHARQGSDAATIITSTIELGHSMGLRVVAEGVEEPAEWNLLRELGCDYAQGYLISKPLPAADVPGFVGQANSLLPASDSTVLQIRALEQLAGQNRR